MLGESNCQRTIARVGFARRGFFVRVAPGPRRPNPPFRASGRGENAGFFAAFRVLFDEFGTADGWVVDKRADVWIMSNCGGRSVWLLAETKAVELLKS